MNLSQERKRLLPNSAKVVLAACPLWTVLTPHYSVALLASCAKTRGFDVTISELEIEFYRHIDPSLHSLWEGSGTCFWDTEEGPDRLFEEHLSDFFEPKARKIVDLGADIVALSVNNRSRTMTQRFVGVLKNLNPNLYIILGGPTAFSNPVVLWDMPGVDAVCMGEGEELFPTFLTYLKENGIPENYPGFTLRKADGSLSIGERQRGADDLDSLPFPDYTMFHLDQYVAHGTLATAFSRGCLQRCAYCAESPNFGKYRSRSGKNLHDEVRFHIENCQMQSLNLLLNDSLINGDLAALNEFADCIISSGTKVSWGGMAVARDDMNLEYLQKMKRAGCVDLSFGIESGSPAVLKLMRKRLHTPEKAEKVIREAKEAGIRNTVYIIVGFPGETEENFYETLNFLRRIFPYLNQLAVNKLLLLEGSVLEKKAELYGLIDTTVDGFTTKDGTTSPEIRKQRQNVLYLLFQEKCMVLGEIGGEGYDPVGQLRRRNTELESQVRQIDGIRAELETRGQKTHGGDTVLSLWRNGAEKLWKLNGQLKSGLGGGFVSLGDDPFLVGPTFTADAGRPRFLKLRLRHDSSEPRNAQVFWRHPDDVDFSEEQSEHFMIPPESGPNGAVSVYVNLRKDPNTRALPIVQLRLDPPSAPTTFFIDDILVF